MSSMCATFVNRSFFSAGWSAYRPGVEVLGERA
jgi:hypothetical protein